MTYSLHRLLRTFVACAMAVGVAALAACTSPASRFYTLTDERAAPSSVPGAGTGMLIDVAAVHVPASVAMRQIVVRTSATQARVLENERWASDPADEIRTALSSALTQRVGAVDEGGLVAAPADPAWRVAVDVKRFESWPGSHTLIDVVWTVRPAESGPALTCRTVVSVPVSAGYDEIVAGHRRELDVIAGDMASGIRSLERPAFERGPAGTDKPDSKLVPAPRCPG